MVGGKCHSGHMPKELNEDARPPHESSNKDYDASPIEKAQCHYVFLILP